MTLNNSGITTVTVSQTTISGADFALTGGTPLSSIPAGQSATLKIQFASSSSGGSSGTLTVTSDADNSPTAVTLTGTGVAATSQPRVSPSSVNFGNVVVGVSIVLNSRPETQSVNVPLEATIAIDVSRPASYKIPRDLR